jgi:tRNA pseudouridine13 synthase
MLSVNQLPFLTDDLPGIGGAIKERPEDFAVDEVPLYEPSGSGTHVYFRIEKVGIPTPHALLEIARALGRSERDIGCAGLKDAHAVTTQLLSLEHIDPALIERLSVPRIRVLSVSRHTNKLKRGHLKGNRFRIKVREADPARVADARATLAVLSRAGVPNYFGPQRFGLRGDTWQIGRALLRRDYGEALAVMLGRPAPEDHGVLREARELFDRGEFGRAEATWPRLFRAERNACRALAQTGGNNQRAVRAIDRRTRTFFLSAYQSFLFNQVVARRIRTLDRLLAGDLAWRHPQGAVFLVEDVAREQPRCDAFEISPTGPLFGPRMAEPGGEPGDLERTLLEAENLSRDAWRAEGGRSTRGGRRPLRFRPHEAAVEPGDDDAGPFLEFRFFLESGCYATAVLREVCKSEALGGDDADGDDS